MRSKLFFVDQYSGVRKTYADLVKDVNSIRSFPNIVYAENHYELLTFLVAAITGNQDISLAKDVHAHVNNLAESRLVESTAKLHVKTLWSRILESTSRIGLFTSGTTGRSRLVQHGMNTLTRTIRCVPQRQSDVWGLTYDPASFAGIQVIFQSLCNFNTLVRLSGLDEIAQHEVVQSERVSHIGATPTWLRLFCSGKTRHPSLAQISVGGEIADASLFIQAQGRFENAAIRNIYASTEFGSLLYSNGEAFSIPAALAGKIKVEHGVLAVHRSLLSATIQGSDVGEFYWTDDCVEVLYDSPLTFRFVARQTDWINVAGNKVNPHEVEKLLMSLDGVVDALVYGRKNSVTGSLVCCKVICSRGSGLTTTSVRQALKNKVAEHWIPRIVEFVDFIDKTSTGKKNRPACI